MSKFDVCSGKRNSLRKFKTPKVWKINILLSDTKILCVQLYLFVSAVFLDHWTGMGVPHQNQMWRTFRFGKTKPPTVKHLLFGGSSWDLTYGFNILCNLGPPTWSNNGRFVSPIGIAPWPSWPALALASAPLVGPSLGEWKAWRLFFTTLSGVFSDILVTMALRCLCNS